MKKIIFTSLLLITPFCKAADPQNAMAEVHPDAWVNIANYTTQYLNIYTARLFGLNHLDLIGYQLTAIPEDLDLPNLQVLNLSNNLIETIANPNLPDLYQLYLNNNHIEYVDHLDLPNLQMLNLSNNHIEYVDHLDLPNLIDLRLSNNRIETITNPNLPNLQALNLSHNQIAAIPDNLNFPNLRNLDLNNNQIEYVNPQIFNQFPELRYLDLTENSLTQENIDELKVAIQQANRNITLFATANPSPGIRLKPAKKS